MKRISIPEENIQTLVEEFRQTLLNLKSNQEKITFEKKFSELTKINEEEITKPVIYFSMESWIKMQQLVKHCDKEIAWQATVEKRKYKGKEDSKDFYYYIKQVFVYPQTVTATFVDVNEAKYADWSMKLDEETYNSLRFQGHSHVNMGTTPSATDLNTYQNFLEQLSKDDFYIFFILNKRGDFTLLLYDYAQDIIFETKDCYIDVLTSQGSLIKWTEENLKQIEEKKNKTHNYEYTGYARDYDKWGATSKKITYATDTYYVENGRMIEFLDSYEAALFFIDHPDLVTATTPSFRLKSIMQELRQSAEEEQDTTAKKRGRPKKGVKNELK